MSEFKSGFIAIVGRTNVGKSTLINTIINQKLTIVSDKPQTTRNNIRLIHTTPTCQMVFFDTPGFHKPKTKLSNFMVESSTAAIRDVDIALMVVEEDDKIGRGDQFLLDKLKNAKCPVVLAINKIDKVAKESLLHKIRLFEPYSFISEIVPVSAKTGLNVPELLSVLESLLPYGPKYFPDDMVTDKAERFFVAELIREKILAALREEIPHGIAVDILSMKERKQKNIIDIEAEIYCDKNSHKAIVIGKNGDILKWIGTASRRDIERILGMQANLQLWVKVRPGWRDKDADLRRMGYVPEK
ncbi:MAG: GTPase Era [Eubacteriaceae bacterium]|nr:GTPase Era [Eubacteriaceae bacterium]